MRKFKPLTFFICFLSLSFCTFTNLETQPAQCWKKQNPGRLSNQRGFFQSGAGSFTSGWAGPSCLQPFVPSGFHKWAPAWLSSVPCGRMGGTWPPGPRFCPLSFGFSGAQPRTRSWFYCGTCTLLRQPGSEAGAGRPRAMQAKLRPTRAANTKTCYSQRHKCCSGSWSANKKATI